MAIPVDSNAGVSESFVAAVERDVVIDLAFVSFVVFGAGHSRFFVGREEKDEIAFGFDLRGVERANRREQRFNVARVVADAGGVDSSVEPLL